MKDWKLYVKLALGVIALVLAVIGGGQVDIDVINPPSNTQDVVCPQCPQCKACPDVQEGPKDAFEAEGGTE